MVTSNAMMPAAPSMRSRLEARVPWRGPACIRMGGEKKWGEGRKAGRPEGRR